ncbi:MAG: S8 family peptidase, partial [Marinobacter sp.]|nr:S8 family peptidase [Marinobacter sp.]
MPDLSGVISMESRTRVDVDTADDIRLGVNGTNDSASTAQVLPNTAVVGGYLSFSSGRYQTGTSDVFEYPADRVDTYAASLAEGDRISLQIFGAPEGFLLSAVAPQRRITVRDADTNEEVFQVSESSGSLPISGVLPEGSSEGAYLIEVSTSGGSPFRYVLTLAGEGAQSMMSTRYAEPDFLLDEAVVTLRPALMSAKDAGAVAQAMSANNARPLGGNSWLLRRSTAQPLSALSAQASKQARDDTVAWIRELQQRPDIAHAEPNYLYRTQMVQPEDDDFYTSNQWNLPLINLPLAWQVAPEAGEGVGIAILDTGLFRNTPAVGGAWHPDLAANVVTLPGQLMDYVSADKDIDNRFGDPLGRDTNPADPGDGNAQSSNFHGTHVAGIAGAVDNTIGVIGVAPGANILPVRVLGEGGEGPLADLVAAINWAATRSEIDVINLSLGGVGPSQSLEDAINRAWADGKLVVAAAGNAGNDEPTFPAAFSNVVGVGAINRAGDRAPYSNVGPSVDLVAPGGDVRLAGSLVVSAWGSDSGGVFTPEYAPLQGTSMAAPHVSGVYALMKSASTKAGLEMSPGRFFSLLLNGELTSEAPNQTEYGAGTIDALKAVDAALEGNVPTILAASPASLQFNGVVPTQDFRLLQYSAEGNESINVIDVTTEADWLSTDLLSGPLDASESVSVSVDVSELNQSDSYNSEIDIQYSSSDNPEPRTLTVPVTLQFGGSSEDLNAGRHYVLLVSTDDDRDTMAQSVVEASDGQYRYAFDDVPPGEYFLVAGTDMDNNGLICENGEACAEYPVNGLPEKIVIGESPMADVTLSTSFRRPTITSMGMPR